MLTPVRAAGVAAVLSLAFVTGCSSSSDSKAEAPKVGAPKAGPTEAVLPKDVEVGRAEPATRTPDIVPDPIPVGVGGTAHFKVGGTKDPSAATAMTAEVVKARYVTPEEIGAEHRGKGQLLVLTLTIKNIGHHVGAISTDGAVKWQDEKTSPRVATTDEAVDGPELDTEYEPGQSVTGSLVLQVGRKGGSVSYIDDPSRQAFTVKLPAA
ncbi:hypothetical protein ACIQOF_37695 [Streptomyces sp. NPDC091265]|uniref:hypothetical protein n=1 Tax=unclassified Streptomyces TaxID=2593676 RepID=UPI00344D3E75